MLNLKLLRTLENTIFSFVQVHKDIFHLHLILHILQNSGNYTHRTI